MQKIPLIANMVNKVIPYFTEHLYRNALYLIVRTGITSLLGFFFWLIVARIYSEVEVGYSSAIISALGLVVAIGLLGLNSALVRFLPGTSKPRERINSAFTLGGIASMVTAVIFVAGIYLWSPGIGFVRDNLVFALTFVVSVVAATLSHLLDSIFIVTRRAVFILIKDTGISLVKILLVVGLSVAFHAFGIVASWGLALSIAFAVFLFFFIPKVQADYKPRATLDGVLIREMWRYSGASYVVSLLSSASVYVLPLLVLNLLGVYSNAYFYIAWMVANLLNAIPLSVANSFFAESTNFPDNQTIRRNLAKSLKFAYLLVVPVLAIVLLASQWLLTFFGQSYVSGALMLLWLLSFSSLFIVFIDMYISILRAKDKLKELLLLRGLTLVLVVALTYLVLPKAGLLGIGYVWLGVQAFTAIVLLIRLRVLLKEAVS